MGKLVYALALLLSIGLAGCKKDELSIKQRVIGKWNYLGYSDMKPLGSVAVFTAQPQGSYYNFKSDGSLERLANGNLTQDNWIITGNNTVLKLINSDVNFKIGTADTQNMILYLDETVNNQINRRTFYFAKF